MSIASPATQLGISGYVFSDLHDPHRLADLYARFCEEAESSDPALWSRWDAYRREPDAPRAPTELSSLLTEMAPHVSRFISRLFDTGRASSDLTGATHAQDDLFRFKVDFVRRRALPLTKSGAVPRLAEDDQIIEALMRELGAGPQRVELGVGPQRVVIEADPELAVAHAGCALLDQEKASQHSPDPASSAELTRNLDALKRWCAARIHDPAYRHWVIFRFPETLDYWHLVETKPAPLGIYGPDRRLRFRDGFTLTDGRMKPREVLSEIHYCVLCHERDKDSCSKGLHERDGTVTVNPLGIELPGCPLGEKISEMHALRKVGDAIGALALVAVDNPMCPGTGHRICNDCMKSCIYQKQDPVNIPQIESGVLTDVLNMPWGVEMYGLLTRWNPLNVRRPYALPYNGKNILVVGLGPAGYTLAHYLMNEGFGVVGIDALKIEPLPDDLVGSDEIPPQPVRDWGTIYRELDERVLEGFGGVSEYGITVRWDKNFLTLLHLTLARRRTLKMYGGVRFGGTLAMDDAWDYGFDHVAIAAGAGRPTVIDLKNNLVRGIRKASDFLMALQLTGAFKRSALPNLQARLPAVVIGGGLTAIDTATELMAYYPMQVEKTLEQYETLCAELGTERVRSMYDPEELTILDEFVEHGRAVRSERVRAATAGQPPNFVELVRGWGGVTIAYRKRLVDSPAYRLNHEEVIKALEEGIAFAENLNPVEARLDAFGAVAALECDHATLPAKTVLVAAGTTPNITYEKERIGTFELDAKRKFFQPHRVVADSDGSMKLVPDPDGFFTSYAWERSGASGSPRANRAEGFGERSSPNEQCFVSFYGDNHPRYAGNVVKAMASAKHGYQQITKLFSRHLATLDPREQQQRDDAWSALLRKLDDDLVAKVVDVVRLTPTIVEVIVRAPAAARHFRPGQFFRLQNYESLAPRIGKVPLLMEGIALTGAWVDEESGLISLIALELGVSSRLLAFLKKGERVVVMGPTGAPTEIPKRRNVLLLGGGLGNAVLFSIARAMRDAGNRVVYFAGYKKGEDLFKREEIEAATDQVIWSTDMSQAIEAHRPQDAHFRGNIVQAVLAYESGALGTPLVPLATVDRIIAIGSDRMMAAVKAARHGSLQAHLRPDHVAIASINSPMQCMMKEVCAQCLQKHVDPVTGRENIIFSCFNQDQDMDRVDFANLATRLRQNTVQEKLSNMWLDHLLSASEREPPRRADPLHR